jgi:hypothetical protein
VVPMCHHSMIDLGPLQWSSSAPPVRSTDALLPAGRAVRFRRKETSFLQNRLTPSVTTSGTRAEEASGYVS